jgi:hypothetical protein
MFECARYAISSKARICNGNYGRSSRNGVSKHGTAGLHPTSSVRIRLEGDTGDMWVMYQTALYRSEKYPRLTWTVLRLNRIKRTTLLQEVSERAIALILPVRKKEVKEGFR